MGVRTFSTFTTADTPLVTVAETVIATLAGTSTNQNGQTFSLRGEATIVSGTATTGVTLRVRRDNVAGTLVGEAMADVLEAAVGSVETHDIYVEEVGAGEFSGRTYVLTVQQVAATGNGNVTSASLVANATP